MTKRPLRRASELTEEHLSDPEYAALYDEVAREDRDFDADAFLDDLIEENAEALEGLRKLGD